MYFLCVCKGATSDLVHLSKSSNNLHIQAQSNIDIYWNSSALRSPKLLSIDQGTFHSEIFTHSSLDFLSGTASFKRNLIWVQRALWVANILYKIIQFELFIFREDYCLHTVEYLQELQQHK